LGYGIAYGSLDGAVLAPILNAKWRDLFARFPSLRRKILEDWYPYAPSGDEGSGEQVLAALSGESVRTTLRSRGPTQLLLLDYLSDALVALRVRFTGASGGPAEHLVPLSVATEGRLQGQVSLRTLRAVCKLHDFPNTYNGFDLPPRLQAVVKGILKAAYRRQLWYRWQGPLLRDSMWSSNCLRSPDTRVFLASIRQAWARNPPVPELELVDPDRNVGDSVARFRDFEIARELYKAAHKASRFEQPLAYWFWC